MLIFRTSATPSASDDLKIDAAGTIERSVIATPAACARAPISRIVRINNTAASESPRSFQVLARVVTASIIKPAQATNFDHSRLTMLGTALENTPAASIVAAIFEAR